MQCVCVWGGANSTQLGWRLVHTGVSGQPNAYLILSFRVYYSSHLAYYVYVYHTCIYDTIYVAVKTLPTLSKHIHSHPDAVHSVLFKALWF